MTLTFAGQALLVYARASHHDIVDDGETALAGHPFTLTVLETTIGQDRSLVQVYAAVVQLPGYGQVFGVEKVPTGTVDNLIWGVPEDVNDRIGGIENQRLVGKVLTGSIG